MSCVGGWVSEWVWRFYEVLVFVFCFVVGDVSIGIKCVFGVVGFIEVDIDFDIIRNDNDIFIVKYIFLGVGRYIIMVLFVN